MAREHAALGTPRCVRSSVLASSSRRNAESARRLIARSAGRDVAAPGLALDLVDVGDGSAIAAGVLVFVTLGANAATARVESGHGVDALATTRAGENIAALIARTTAHAGSRQERLGALGRLRTARGRTGIASRASRARRAVVATREGITRAG